MKIKSDFMSLTNILNFLKILNFNSIENSFITDRIVICNKLKEYGVIRLKINKGIIPFPKLLYFSVPFGSKIDDFLQEYPESSNLILIHPSKGYQIDISKIKFSKNLEVSIKYEKYIEKEVFNLIKLEIDKEKIYVINNSDINFKEYKITNRILLPIHLRDIIEFDEKMFKEYIENKIEIEDEIGNKIEFLRNFNTYLKNNRIEVDVSWLIDLNPHKTISFKVILNTYS